MLAFAYCSEPLSPKIGNCYNALRMLKKGNVTQQVDKKKYNILLNYDQINKNNSTLC